MYLLELDGEKIGESSLDHADPPMGVVNGTIRFHEIEDAYTFLREYCSSRGIQLNASDDTIGLIDTWAIPGLKVITPAGKTIPNEGCSISGLNEEGYEVTILGIPYPFFDEEFPIHAKTYEDQFK